MDKWQPIETAPIGVTVELARWHVSMSGGTKALIHEAGVAKIKTLFGARLTYEGRINDYWRPLPEPPED